MKGLLAAVALASGWPGGPASAVATVETHLDCMANYALLGMAAPSFAEVADRRGASARQAYLRDLPSASPIPLPLTTGEIDGEVRARMLLRGAPLTGAVTDEEITRETDALLADIHACDAQYGFAPLPVPWID